MSQTGASMSQHKYDASVGTVDMKLEVIVIPVSDVDRAKEFYRKLGWRLDAGFEPACSITWSDNIGLNPDDELLHFLISKFE
jgi:catechol 2,3-dioxygenase-like lactoylglutathione lyase family enzyme